jgi:hypothetical protein
MKENELRKHATCSRCGNKIGHTGLPLFWTLKVDRYGIDMDAVQRQSGLSMFLGNAALAGVMGPDEDMAKKMIDTQYITLCEDCAVPIMDLIECCQEDEDW